MPAPTRTVSYHERIAELLTQMADQVTLLQTRVTVTRLVARDTSQWVDDDARSLDLIVDDVLNEWRQHKAGDADPAALDGLWNRYASRVEWASPDSGHEYRSEFCPADEKQPFDSDGYFRAVWAAHLDGLRQAANGVQSGA